MRQFMLLVAVLYATWALPGCAMPSPLGTTEQARLAALLPADVLLLGEQHDAPTHQQLQRQVVEWLAARGELTTLALEMAEQGHGTAGLPRNASEARVQRALAWRDAGWPWKTYRPVVMAAVRAGVPVLGANLPTARQRQVMRDATLEARLPPDALAEQQQRMRDGHCGMLPQSQIMPMTRVQIARDIAMADTVRAAWQPGRTVLLIAGNGHVHRALGVPLHLPSDMKVKVLSARSAAGLDAAGSEAPSPPPEPGSGADLVWPTPPLPPRDYCAEFRRATRAPGN
ncbi:MAG: ChaN family lipoprotein [Pseudomonadota bacterium]|nr:ChaN family lipoprotein [Pseudomonadota bacterium]